MKEFCTASFDRPWKHGLEFQLGSSGVVEVYISDLVASVRKVTFASIFNLIAWNLATIEGTDEEHGLILDSSSYLRIASGVDEVISLMRALTSA